MNEYKCPYCGIECATVEARAGHMSVCTRSAVIGSPIYVGPEGSDTEGFGTQALPYKTLSKALTMASVNHTTIFMLPGEYAEATKVVWPNVTGINVIGLGPVSISNADASDSVIVISPTYTAGSFEATLKDVNIAADTQIGLSIGNDHMSKKLNVYLSGVSFEMDTSGDSINLTNAVATQAIRIYADGCEFEGLVHVTSANAGGRYRFTTCTFTGGLTVAGAVACELGLIGCVILASGFTHSNEQWLLNVVGSVYRTDADPAIYTELANAYATL